MTQMTPQEIVHELDKHIIGQDAKPRRRHCAAQSLASPASQSRCAAKSPQEHPDDRPHRRRQDRNRPPPGPLSGAPFIKVEATKFTEVGYVGRDVDTIIRDLVEVAIKETRDAAIKRNRVRAEDAAEDRILDVLLPPARSAPGFFGEPQAEDSKPEDGHTRQKFRKMLREGKLDDKEIEIEVAAPQSKMEILPRRAWKTFQPVAKHVPGHECRQEEGQQAQSGRSLQAADRRRSRQAGQRRRAQGRSHEERRAERHCLPR
jgi:ATP-dependent HslUV protease ATP-binding subunit HslU